MSHTHIHSHHTHDCSSHHHDHDGEAIGADERQPHQRRNRELYSAFLTPTELPSTAHSHDHQHAHHDHHDHFANAEEELEEDIHMATVLESFCCYEQFHMAMQHRAEHSARELLSNDNDAS